MLRWTVLLCICLYLVFVLGPDPVPPAEDPVAVAPEVSAAGEVTEVTLESGEVWSIDRTVGEDAADPAPAPITPVATQPQAPASEAPTAIETALQEAQAAEVETTEPETENPQTPEPRPAEPQTPAPAPEAQITLLYVTGTRVNLRAGPSTDDTIVTALTQGTPVEWLGEAPDGWLEIRDTLTGARGFMSGDFLSPDAP